MIPPVIPNGMYLLGWVWFVGTSGSITTNDPQVPKKYSYFSDYWSCSFIKIEGGVPLEQLYTPVFDNDCQFDPNAESAEGMVDGCMVANDRPGICISESCQNVESFYCKPAAYKNGPPKPLTPAEFGGSIAQRRAPPPAPATEEPVATADPTPETAKSEASKPTKPMEKEYVKPEVIKSPKPMNRRKSRTKTKAPEPTKPTEPMRTKAANPSKAPKRTRAANPTIAVKPTATTMPKAARKKAFFSCMCLRSHRYGSFCGKKYAMYSSECTPYAHGYKQTSDCNKSCCSVCKYGRGRLCWKLRHICKH